MEIQIDMTKKLIKIKETVDFKELVETLEKLLPNGLWKEFQLEPYTSINVNYPIYTEPSIYKYWHCEYYC